MNPLYQQQVIPQRNEPIEPVQDNIFSLILSGHASPKSIAINYLKNLDNSTKTRLKNSLANGVFKSFATRMGVSEANYNSFVNDINSMI